MVGRMDCLAQWTKVYLPAYRTACEACAAFKSTCPRRCSICSHTWRLPSSGSVLQAAISSSVRQQPLHKLVEVSIWHNDVQGDATVVILYTNRSLAQVFTAQLAI